MKWAQFIPLSLVELCIMLCAGLEGHKLGTATVPDHAGDKIRRIARISTHHCRCRRLSCSSEAAHTPTSLTHLPQQPF
ncbi:hypothetical protein F5Y15DRAFT_389927 [Xylariaceae sp. FL0016]|nr:hypothetical protein F5Y15DRAFT_389927 [Xylariaceae sp. FL0016]